MTTALTRGYVAMTYLLGARGDTLVEALPAVVAEFEVGLVRGLCSSERDVRARHLAVGLRELTTELQRRELSLKSP
jgi:hypothetical protein